MAKYIAFTIFDTTDNSSEAFSIHEPNEQIDALSNDEIKSALAFGLAAKVTGIMDVVTEMAISAKDEVIGRIISEVTPDKQPDEQPDRQSDDEYRIIG